jgi:8-oxo-dGTP diphosphatase
MKRYVLGFCFGPSLRTVVLIRKTRPEWQAGRLNGVGGHIEDGETPLAAMKREFCEEADCATVLPWVNFGVLRGDGWEVHLFHAETWTIPLPFHQSEEGEVAAHFTNVVIEMESSQGAKTLPNLRYLIPMALNHLRGVDAAKFFDISELGEPT